MSIQEVAPEQLAQLFHHYHQALAPDFNGTRKPYSQVWKEVPQQERERLIAAARLALLELSTTDDDRKPSIAYFAEPGEAEWGC